MHTDLSEKLSMDYRDHPMRGPGGGGRPDPEASKLNLLQFETIPTCCIFRGQLQSVLVWA
jgi:hypothetical protein